MNDNMIDIRIDRIGLALSSIEEMLHSKGMDYSRGSSDPFVNFKETANIIGIPPSHVALVQCGIKMSRIRHLEESSDDPVNESLMDSYLDLACYAVLAYAMEMEKRA